MDFDSLARKDLQALCKLNKIPANITNVAMAQALKSLEIVEGIEEILNRSPERNVATATKVPRTGRRTCTRSKPIGDESSQSVQAMAKSTRRTTIRAICDEIMDESKTPAVRSSRKATNLKEVSTVQRVYSTRRSARLTGQSNVESITMEQKEEKIDSLATELSKIDLVDVADDKSVSVIDSSEVVLQEPVMKSDVEALETVSNIEGNEFNDQKTKSEKILMVVDELNDVQVCITNSLMIEDEEIVDELKEKAELLVEAHVISESLVIKNQECAMDSKNLHEQKHGASLESRTDLTHLTGDNDMEKIVDEQKEESEQLSDTIDESDFVHEVNVNNMEIKEKTEEENVEESFMDSDNPNKQLRLEVDEEYKFSNVESDVSAIVDSPAGDSYLVEQMTFSEVFKAESPDLNDTEECADKVEPFIVDFHESKAETFSNDLKDVATGIVISSIASFMKAPSMVPDCVLDDKENIDHGEVKSEPKKAETTKNNNETITTELNTKSLRELTKMLKEKLQISNDTTEEIGDEVKAYSAEA